VAVAEFVDETATVEDASSAFPHAQSSVAMASMIGHRPRPAVCENLIVNNLNARFSLRSSAGALAYFVRHLAVGREAKFDCQGTNFFCNFA
jgi:hypothetical protein